jgi:hypothetical protein
LLSVSVPLPLFTKFPVPVTVSLFANDVATPVAASSVAPLATTMSLRCDPIVFDPLNTSVPAFTVVNPLYVFDPLNV